MRWIHTEDNQKKLLSAIVIFNLIDTILTITMINLGFAAEANPFMLELIEISETLFAIVKLSLVSFSVQLFWLLRSHKASRNAAAFCFCIYSVLMFYHIFGIIVSIYL